MYPICSHEISRLSVPLLILIGGEDRVVSVPACRKFQRAVSTGNLEMVVYPGAKHGFDASRWATYDRSAATDAFQRLRRHLE